MIYKVDNEDRVYIIGQHTKYIKKVLFIIAFLVVGILGVIVGVYLYNKQTSPQKTSQGKSLEEVEVISKDVHINFLSSDKNKRKAEIDFITNGTIHLFVDYFKGKIPQTLDEIGEGIISVINRIFELMQ